MHNTLRFLPSEVVIKRYFKRAIFGSHVHCPECGSRFVRMVKSEERWRCRRCDFPFSVKSCSWLKGSKLSWSDLWVLIWCWQKKFSKQHTKDICGLSYPTISHWYGEFRDHIPQELLLQTMLSGDIACDEMYTKHQAIIGAKEKGTRNIALRIINEKSVNKSDAISFLQTFARPNSTVSTDGSKIYKGMDTWAGLKHRFEIHKRFEFELTSEIEGLWACFRTFVRRMYHHVTRYKLGKIVSEFTLRFRQHRIFNSPLDYISLTFKTSPFAF